MENKKLILTVLYEVGYRYLSRDWDGEVWVFNKEPVCVEGEWQHVKFSIDNQVHKIPHKWGLDEFCTAEAVEIEDLLRKDN